MDKRENGIFTGKKDVFLARVDRKTGNIQSVCDHLSGVVQLSERNCPLDILKTISVLIGALHDAGKLSDDFQAYMESIKKNGERAPRRRIDHSSYGGQIIEKLGGRTTMAQMAATAVYSHHGLCDCIDLATGLSLSEQRRKDKAKLELVKQRYFEICDKDVFMDCVIKAHKDTLDILKNIREFMIQAGPDHGNDYFYVGMFERLLLSILIDSDWSDAASFSGNMPLPKRMSEEAIKQIWNQSILHFEDYIKRLTDKNPSPLNRYRDEISRQCQQMGMEKGGVYRVTLATGAGKTLSCLRFALHHAQSQHKNRIIYVAPYHSILEQNAEEIRKALGDESLVLEHHCNVILEDAAQQEVYEKLTENWDSPVIATTAVQMLESLFSGKMASIRRMYSLCNSVIIFDEVQALPVRCIELFNLAVNFLANFCDTTVVLCSATQPSLATLPENNIFGCQELIKHTNLYDDIFKRAIIEDKTGLIPGGMEIDDLKHFIFEQMKKYKKVLVIVNTRQCARDLYKAVKAEARGIDLYHLSTKMCPEHRHDELFAIRQALEDSERFVVCVSTQLVEAGVDLSFECVIRSRAGLDSIIQAAGRCNRHRKMPGPGCVYIVKMSTEAENLKSLPDIKIAQKAFDDFLYDYQHKNVKDDHIDSQSNIRHYYERYYRLLQDTNWLRTKYPIDTGGLTIVGLLGENPSGGDNASQEYKGCLRQAFKMAGDAFKVIPEDQNVNVVVPYNHEVRRLLKTLEDEAISVSEKRLALRMLQRYCVGIDLSEKAGVGNDVYWIDTAGIYVLNPEKYDSKLGVMI